MTFDKHYFCIRSVVKNLLSSPARVLYEDRCGDGSCRSLRQVVMGAGRFAFSWFLIWVFSLGSRPFQSIQAEVKRDLINYLSPLLFHFASHTAERSCLEVLSDQKTSK